VKKELGSDLEEPEEIWFAGVDWGSQVHQVRVCDRRGRSLGDRGFAHSGEGLAELAAWILQKTGASPGAVHVAIEVPHGPVVESLMERGFQLYSINPKQLDRFRDRFSPSGSKDDSRDALVLADSLRTDRRSFRALRAVDPLVVELREWSRIAEELGQDQLRLANRIQSQLWRYFPQLLTFSDGTIEPWLLALWQLAPTPAKAARLRESTIARLLKNNRIRRVSAVDITQALRAPAIPMAPGAVESAVAHIKILIGQIEPVRRQIKQANAELKALLEHFLSKEETAEGQQVEQRDVTILRSLPGVGKTVLATLLRAAKCSCDAQSWSA
jgi:Transposase